MFLKCLGPDDCEEKYWPFVLRLETVLYGIISGSADRFAAMPPEDRLVFLFETLGVTMDRREEKIPAGWWPEPAPDLEWFDAYLKRHQDALVKEAERLAPMPLDNRKKESEDAFDKQKVRDFAHQSETFCKFLFPSIAEHEHNHDPLHEHNHGSLHEPHHNPAHKE